MDRFRRAMGGFGRFCEGAFASLGQNPRKLIVGAVCLIVGGAITGGSFGLAAPVGACFLAVGGGLIASAGAQAFSAGIRHARNGGGPPGRNASPRAKVDHELDVIKQNLRKGHKTAEYVRDAQTEAANAGITNYEVQAENIRRRVSPLHAQNYHNDVRYAGLEAQADHNATADALNSIRSGRGRDQQLLVTEAARGNLVGAHQINGQVFSRDMGVLGLLRQRKYMGHTPQQSVRTH